MIKSPDTYQGKQIILTSDRLIFNAREDQVYSSDSTIAFSTNKDFHINTSEGSNGLFIVNSPKIRLGKISDTSPEAPNNPAVKGNELVSLMGDILDHIDKLYNTVLPALNQITIFPGLPTIPNPVNSSLIAPLSTELKTLKGRLNSINSKNVYIK